MIDKKVYVYPKLDAFLNVGIRIGGFGLANCLFVYSRALVLSKVNNYSLINPTWKRFGIGQYIRNEKDKRHYFNIFHNIGITGLKKYYLINFKRKVNEKHIIHDRKSDILLEVKGLNDYFISLLPYHNIIEQNLIQLSKIKLEKNDFNDCIAIHIRLGDFVNENRTPINWYVEMIHKIKQITNSKFKFLIFSDGSDKELEEVLNIKDVKRKPLGNAMLEIIAMSYCIALVGSDSTFSGWAAFLGQKPCIFRKKHFGQVLIEETHDYSIEIKDELPSSFIKYLNHHI